MTNKVKKEYVAPMVESLEAHVERGFAGSGNSEPSTNPEQIGDSGYVYEID